MNLTLLVFVGLIGICLGSFVNAWVWRLSQQLDADGNSVKSKGKTTRSTDYSIVKGRSMCPNCKHALTWYDLIPVISWISLGGKCRYCKKPISPQYPLVELATGFLFALSYVAWPFVIGQTWVTVAFVSWLAILVGLVALVIYDAKYLLLPNRIVYPLIGIAGASLLVQFVTGRPVADIAGICTALLITSGIFWLLFQVSGGAWIGGGDVKLGILAGLLIASASQALLYLFIASLLGLLYSFPLMATKQLTKASRVPFGPFLIASLIMVVLWGADMVSWYTGTFLAI